MNARDSFPKSKGYKALLLRMTFLLILAACQHWGRERERLSALREGWKRWKQLAVIWRRSEYGASHTSRFAAPCQPFPKDGIGEKSKFWFSFQNDFQTDLLVMMGAGMGGRFESEVWPNMPGMSRSCLLCAKFKPFKPGIARFPLTQPQENKALKTNISLLSWYRPTLTF